MYRSPADRLGTTRRRCTRAAAHPGWILAIVVIAVLGCNADETEPASSSASLSASLSDEADAVHPKPSQRKNVLLITLDTVRADALGVYGQKRPTSPVLDRLAREGVFFEQVASAAPSTLPSHTSIMTGLYPFAHGARSNSGYTVSQQVETLAEVLSAHGYRTGAEIAAPVINATTLLDQGFEQYQDLNSTNIEKVSGLAAGPDGKQHHVELEERDATDIARCGIRYIDEHASEPFFLWLHFFDPHRRYAARPEYDALIPDSRYHAEIRHVDTQIGRVIEEIEKRGLRDHTLVVVVADHGEGLGEHGELTHAYYVYESTIHVPLIFWGPKDVQRSEPVKSLARTVDIAPTILDYLGLPPLPAANGVSLLPRMRGQAGDPSLSAYGESIEIVRFVGGSPIRYLRRGDWKYIHKVEPELYDIAEDPHEEHNLAASHPEKLKELRAALEQLIANAPAPPRDAEIDPSAEQKAQLRALGYIGDSVGRSDLDDLLATTELRGTDPNDVAADIDAYSKAVGRIDVGDPDKALTLLRPLLARHPDSPEILSCQADALLALGDLGAARDVLSKILTLSPCSVGAYERLGQALQSLNADKEAFELLRRGALECPDQYALVNNYAYALATSDDPARRDGPEAVRLAEHALRLTSGARPEILDTVAAAQAAVGNLSGAGLAAKRALVLARRQKLSPDLLSHLESQVEVYDKARLAAAATKPTGE